jgi:hypothetical protein
MGKLLGCSKRTVQRWAAGQAHPDAEQLATLARRVYPEDAGLAAELAAAADQTLESLRLVKPAPSASAAESARADAVVCAGADAVDTTPSVVRAILLAALRRARELGLAAEEVEKALDAHLVAPRAKRR